VGFSVRFLQVVSRGILLAMLQRLLMVAQKLRDGPDLLPRLLSILSLQERRQSKASSIYAYELFLAITWIAAG
jgi:hypothetical protein